jgi:hypothetical protein
MAARAPRILPVLRDPPERTTLALLLMEFLLRKRYDLHFTLINQ